MTVFTLTNLADHIDNTSDRYGNHTWKALKGDDVLYLGGGRDVAYGDLGNDYIDGSYGNDKLYGDAGHDVLKGGLGIDELYGGDGNDTINDLINDTINSPADKQADIIFGGKDNDTIYTDGGKVDAGVGSDTVHVWRPAAVTDVILGPQGNDHVDLDLIYSSHQRVDIHGFQAADKLTVNADNGPVTGPYDTSQIFDLLDRDNDGWLGVNDVDTDNDGYGMYVGTNSLTLEIAGTDVVLNGMTTASLDFLS